MSEEAIRKLRRKFILVSTLSMAIVMTTIALLIYLSNLALAQRTIRQEMNLIIENYGDLPENEEITIQQDSSGVIRFLDEIFGNSDTYNEAEMPYSLRYFAVIYDENGELTDVKTSHIASVTEAEAESYGEYALQHRSFGHVDNYYYEWRVLDSGDTIVVYLEASQTMVSNNRILYLAMILIVIGVLCTLFISRIFANRAIAPEVKNAELQKQFITNASHELKTPLAVIRANTEMQEMLSGETEWTQSTMRQVERMDGLIKNLVLIARADEQSTHLTTDDVNVTHAVTETVDNFVSLIEHEQKTLTRNIPDGITMRADESQIRQLTSLLMDNAIKYCDDNGEVKVDLSQRGKGIQLVVSNSYAEGANTDYSRFFERFYRKDQSHNTDKGGYGVGLSIAEAICSQYKGSISADWKKGIISFTCYLKQAPVPSTPKTPKGIKSSKEDKKS